MGLGPPVCKKCMLVMDLTSEDERNKDIAAWVCDMCGLGYPGNKEKQGDTTNLFCLNDKESEDVETRSYGKWVSEEWRRKNK